jgi:hypothetical protein
MKLETKKAIVDYNNVHTQLGNAFKILAISMNDFVIATNKLKKMKKNILLIALFLLATIAKSQEIKTDSIATINKAIAIQQRVESKGNSNTVQEIQTAVSEISELIPNCKSDRALADLKYLRAMTIYSLIQFSFVGDKLTQAEKIDVCKKTIADLEFAEKHGYDDNDSVYIVFKKARKELNSSN